MKSTVSTKGQIVIPKDVRDRHGLKPGSVVEVEDHGHVIVLRPQRAATLYTIADLLALPHHYQGPALSTEDMDRAVHQAMRAGWSKE